MSPDWMVVIAIVAMGVSLFLAMEVKDNLGRIVWCIMTAGWLAVMVANLIKVSNTL